MKELKELITHIISEGFKANFENSKNKIIFEKEGYSAIQIINQKFDGVEVWIGTKESNQWSRIDFMLEYYLSSNIDLTKKFQLDLDNKNISDYYIKFIEKYYKEMSDFKKFKNEEYVIWIKENSGIIEKLRIALQKK